MTFTEKKWVVIIAALVAIVLVCSSVGLYRNVTAGNAPVETHRACYEESFGAGTVPTSIEIPCPDDKNTGEEVTK